MDGYSVRKISSLGSDGYGLSVTRCTSTNEGVMQFGKWYYNDTKNKVYYEVDGGVIAGNGTIDSRNGKWYPSPAAAAAANRGVYPNIIVDIKKNPKRYISIKLL